MIDDIVTMVRNVLFQVVSVKYERCEIVICCDVGWEQCFFSSGPANESFPACRTATERFCRTFCTPPTSIYDLIYEPIR